MQEDIEGTRSSTSGGGQFIDTLIEQWAKRTGTNVTLQPQEEAPSIQESKKVSEGDLHIKTLQWNLKRSLQMETTLSSTLETEIRNRQEIQTKLTSTWEAIETIKEYYNYISESHANFQQHRVNLSNLYDNMILKQQECIQKLQLDNTKLKEQEEHVAKLENEFLLQKTRLQEATMEQDKLRKQLGDSVRELRSQRKELEDAYADEKLILVKEQQRLLLECENLQSRLRTAEDERCDILKSAEQVQNKFLQQGEKLQAALTEQDKLRKELENANNEVDVLKNNVVAHAEEKTKLIEEEQRLLTKCENLQSQLNLLELDKSNIVKTVAQKEELILELQNENSTFKNQIDALLSTNDEVRNKCKTLEDNQSVHEKELRAKTEEIKHLEATLSGMKEREASLINDVNRLETNLANEKHYSNDLKSKLSDMERSLRIAEMENSETKEALKSAEATNKLANIELRKKQKAFEKEKEEAAKRESTLAKNAEVLYENARAKHIEEMSALRSNYEARQMDLKDTIDNLNKTNEDIMQENNALKGENISLKNDYERAQKYNKKNTGTLEVKLNDALNPEKDFSQSPKQTRTKSSERTVRFKPEIVEIFEPSAGHVSTSAGLESRNFDLGDDEQERWQRLQQKYPVEKESPKEQEQKVTSAGNKFFKSRPSYLEQRTYGRRRRN